MGQLHSGLVRSLPVFRSVFQQFVHRYGHIVNHGDFGVSRGLWTNPVRLFRSEVPSFPYVDDPDVFTRHPHCGVVSDHPISQSVEYLYRHHHHQLRFNRSDGGLVANVPLALEQAAYVDGCSRVTGIVRIILPLSAPGVAMAGIYSFIFAWNELLIPLIFISESRLRPASLALTDFVGQNVVYWHEMMAASVITTLPVAVLFSFVQRFFIQGFMSGAVKE